MYIKFQFWAFDAILICLIFFTDKMGLLTVRKYFATLDALSSTLEKYKHKFLGKGSLNPAQIRLINSQYTLWLQHLKLYDDESQTYDKLCSYGEDIRSKFFCRMLTSRKTWLPNSLRSSMAWGKLWIMPEQSMNWFPQTINKKKLMMINPWLIKVKFSWMICLSFLSFCFICLFKSRNQYNISTSKKKNSDVLNHFFQ